eukprot:TRINITY_DN92280_c0_g1_i1.p1 TRINITY_DN92280_c0_g1~~TRINITY_DN92280_c0_g1_i1.p1  ORF type:complete len:947 (-),score=239.17 TRINITY_DN92280_c0_g1_i1:181-3021(-)
MWSASLRGKGTAPVRPRTGPGARDAAIKESPREAREAGEREAPRERPASARGDPPSSARGERPTREPPLSARGERRPVRPGASRGDGDAAATAAPKASPRRAAGTLSSPRPGPGAAAQSGGTRSSLRPKAAAASPPEVGQQPLSARRGAGPAAARSRPGTATAGRRAAQAAAPPAAATSRNVRGKQEEANKMMEDHMGGFSNLDDSSLQEIISCEPEEPGSPELPEPLAEPASEGLLPQGAYYEEVSFAAGDAPKYAIQHAASKGAEQAANQRRSTNMELAATSTLRSVSDADASPASKRSSDGQMELAANTSLQAMAADPLLQPQSTHTEDADDDTEGRFQSLLKQFHELMAVAKETKGMSDSDVPNHMLPPRKVRVQDVSREGTDGAHVAHEASSNLRHVTVAARKRIDSVAVVEKMMAMADQDNMSDGISSEEEGSSPRSPRRSRMETRSKQVEDAYCQGQEEQLRKDEARMEIQAEELRQMAAMAESTASEREVLSEELEKRKQEFNELWEVARGLKTKNQQLAYENEELATRIDPSKAKQQVQAAVPTTATRAAEMSRLHDFLLARDRELQGIATEVQMLEYQNRQLEARNAELECHAREAASTAEATVAMLASTGDTTAMSFGDASSQLSQGQQQISRSLRQPPSVGGISLSSTTPAATPALSARGAAAPSKLQVPQRFVSGPAALAGHPMPVLVSQVAQSSCGSPPRPSSPRAASPFVAFRVVAPSPAQERPRSLERLQLPEAGSRFGSFLPLQRSGSPLRFASHPASMTAFGIRPPPTSAPSAASASGSVPGTAVATPAAPWLQPLLHSAAGSQAPTPRKPHVTVPIEAMGVGPPKTISVTRGPIQRIIFPGDPLYPDASANSGALQPEWAEALSNAEHFSQSQLMPSMPNTPGMPNTTPPPSARSSPLVQQRVQVYGGLQWPMRASLPAPARRMISR